MRKNFVRDKLIFAMIGNTDPFEIEEQLLRSFQQFQIEESEFSI